MKRHTKERLKTAQKFCDDNNKSTEFTIQYMQDMTGLNFEAVMTFLRKQSEKEQGNERE